MDGGVPALGLLAWSEPVMAVVEGCGGEPAEPLALVVRGERETAGCGQDSGQRCECQQDWSVDIHIFVHKLTRF